MCSKPQILQEGLGTCIPENLESILGNSTQKWFIKTINSFNGVPKSKLRKIKILMGINLIRGEISRKIHGSRQNNLSL